MGAISLLSRARRWKADGSRAMSGCDISDSISPKRDSMSRSFWKVMESVLRLGRSRSVLLLAPLPRELLDAARGVDQALLAREERVAVGADLQPQLLALGGPRGPCRPAGAVDVDRDVIRMNPWFHRAPRPAADGAAGNVRRALESAATANSSRSGERGSRLPVRGATSREEFLLYNRATFNPLALPLVKGCERGAVPHGVPR